MAIGVGAAYQPDGVERFQGMKVNVIVNGRERVLELERRNQANPCRFRIDRVEGSADIEEVEPGVYSILLGPRSFEVKIEEGKGAYFVSVDGRRYEIAVQDPRRPAAQAEAVEAGGRRAVTCPMPGRILRVAVKTGDPVEIGAGLMVVEAMKMQNELRAPKSGVVVEVGVKEGSSVAAGQVVAVVE